MTIAITGSTGQLGRLVIERLKRKLDSKSLIGLARSASKAADLGIAVREANYDDPASLHAALDGVDTLLLISGNELGKRLPQHRNVIEAAKRRKVGRIVYTSLLHADRSSLSLAPEHLETENELKRSGIPYTILRNGWYTENYTGSVGGAIAAGAFVGSAGQGKISGAARADYADAAVVALTSEGHVGATYELAGDDAFTLSDLAAELSRQTGKNIPYRDLPEAEYAGVLAKFGLPPAFASAIASWDVGASKGVLFDDNRFLSKFIGHPTTPLAEVVKRAIP
ncbi:MAG: SDR family oxidoreductase [Polyangiaceae bacterium]